MWFFGKHIRPAKEMKKLALNRPDAIFDLAMNEIKQDALHGHLHTGFDVTKFSERDVVSLIKELERSGYVVSTGRHDSKYLFIEWENAS